MTPGAGVHRLACVTAGATLVLIVAGGLVTNTGAALAVPDWPTTFGRPMFLYPWSGMVGGVLVEHAHRLIGAAIGLLTVTLALVLAWREPRRWVCRLAGLAVLLVVLQGVVGGLRVVLVRDTLAIVHGCLAPAFFALLTALAVVTGRSWAAPAPAGAAPAPGPLAPLAIASVGVVYGQIVLGALTTHAGRVGWHLGGAVVTVLATVGLAHAVRRRAPGDPVLGGWARAVSVLVTAQLALGAGAYGARFTGLGLPGGQAAVVLWPVAHRAVGALLLGATLALALHLGRRRARVRAVAPAPRVSEVAA